MKRRDRILHVFPLPTFFYLQIVLLELFLKIKLHKQIQFLEGFFSSLQEIYAFTMKGFIFALAVSAFVTASKGKFIHFSVKQKHKLFF